MSRSASPETSSVMSSVMSIEPTGRTLPKSLRFCCASGQSPRIVEERRRPISRSGESMTTDRVRSSRFAGPGMNGERSRTTRCGAASTPVSPLRPGRRCREPGPVGRSQYGQLPRRPSSARAAPPSRLRGCPRASGPGLRSRRSSPAARGAGRCRQIPECRVDHPPTELLGEVRALSPVHRAPRRSTRECSRPRSAGCRVLVAVGVHVVGDRVPHPPAVGDQLRRHHPDRPSLAPCLVPDRERDAQAAPRGNWNGNPNGRPPSRSRTLLSSTGPRPSSGPDQRPERDRAVLDP